MRPGRWIAKRADPLERETRSGRGWVAGLLAAATPERCLCGARGERVVLLADAAGGRGGAGEGCFRP